MRELEINFEEVYTCKINNSYHSNPILANYNLKYLKNL
jgi:hypothetical protein